MLPNCMVLGRCYITFLQLAHMLDATDFYGFREIYITFASLPHMFAAELIVAREMLTFLELAENTQGVIF